MTGKQKEALVCTMCKYWACTWKQKSSQLS